MNTVYFKKVEEFDTKTDRASLLEEQRSWLRDREKACRADEGNKGTVSYLTCLQEKTEERTFALLGR